MLPVLAIAASVALAAPDPGLPIKGVTVEQTMPGNVSHIEAPPFRGYRIMALTPSATPSQSPKAKNH